MKTITESWKLHLIMFILLSLIALWTFKDVFNYGIYCDDILAIFNSVTYGTGRGFHYLFSPYGGQTVGISIMYHFFGLSSSYFFITNFVLRLLSAVSVYFLALRFSDNSRFAAFFSALLFTVSYAGSGTAEYGILANMFISIIFLNFGLAFLLDIYFSKDKSMSPKSWRTYLLVCLLFILAIIMATVRVNSIIFYVVILEISLLFLKLNNLKDALIRTFLLGVCYLILRHLGSFGGSSPYHLEMIKDGFITTFGSISNFAHSVYYLSGFYFDILIPPFVGTFLINTLYQLRFLESIQLNIIYILLALPIFYINYSIIKKNNNPFPFIIHSILWIIYLYGFKWTFGDIFNTFKHESFSSIETTGYLFYAMNGLFGGLVIFLLLDLILYLYYQKKLITTFKVFTLALWPIIFVIVTYFFSPRTFAFDTFSSYLIKYKESYVHYYFVPSLGIYLLLPYLFFRVFPQISKSFSSKSFFYISIALLSFLVLTNAVSVKQWASGRLAFRSSSVLNHVSSSINQEIKSTIQQSRKPLVYFTSIDDNEVFFPYAVSEWGFSPFRYSLLNNDQSNTPLFFSGTEQELEKLLIDSGSSDAHGFTSEIPLSDIYAFKVKDQRIISETTRVRQTLAENLPNIKLQGQNPPLEQSTASSQIQEQFINPDNDVRYKLKRIQEKALFLLIKFFNPSQLNDYLTQLTQSRFEELVYVFENNQIANLEKTTSRYLTQVGEVSEKASQDEDLRRKLSQSTKNYLTILKELKDRNKGVVQEVLLLQSIDTTNQLFLILERN